MGLDQNDRNILKIMIEKFSGGPVGLDTLAAAIGEDSGTIEDVYEPYLVKNGFINRTPKGRVVTDFAYQHFGLTKSLILTLYVIIIPFLTVSKNKIAAMPGNIGVVVILTVVLNYTIVCSSSTFFLDGFHLAF